MKNLIISLLFVVLSWMDITAQSYRGNVPDPFNLRQEIGGFRRDPAAPIMLTGTHCYMSGSQNATFPFVKKYVRNVNGVWTPPIKLLNGIYFQLNSEVGKVEELGRPQAIYVSPVSNTWRYLVANRTALVYREDFCPDGESGLYIKLTIKDVRLESEATNDRVMAWRCIVREEVSPSFFAYLLDKHDAEDEVWVEDGMLCAKDRIHEWYAGVTSIPQPKAINWHGTDSEMKKPVDAHLGDGRWGELTIDVTVPAGSEKSIWIVIGGSSISREGFFSLMKK